MTRKEQYNLRKAKELKLYTGIIATGYTVVNGELVKG